MGEARPRRRLIVNADDFGRSESINRAVIQAHQEGVLTTASLMAGGEAFDEAVQLARTNPRLGVGWHLTVSNGRSVLPFEKIPHLVNSRREFRQGPVTAGMTYFFSRQARAELAEEIRAQWERVRGTGLPLDHVNGHLHFHLHPTVFRILSGYFREWERPAVRLTRDPVRVDWGLGSGRIGYRVSHAIVFSLLSARAGSILRKSGVRHTRFVFGLLENERVTEGYILKLLPRLPQGDSELYSHPSLDRFKHEYEALISRRVREAIQSEGIELIRYQDLWQSS